MKKRYLLFPVFLSFVFFFLFGANIEATLDRVPTRIEENDVFWYSFSEDVSYNAYRATYYYYDALNDKQYVKSEFKLLGEDYKQKKVTLSNIPISDFNNESYLEYFTPTTSSESYYYFEVVLYNRTYSYLGVKNDKEVAALVSDFIKVGSEKVVAAPVLVSPSNNASFTAFLVNFEVESEIDYQIYVREEKSAGSNENWQILNSTSFKGNDNTTYYWKAVDSLGQESEERKFTINIPSELPTFNINGSVSTWNKENVVISVTPSSKGSSYYCLNDDCILINSKKDVVLSEDGTYSFYVKNVSNSNTISSETYSIKLDKTSPKFSKNDYNFNYYLVDNKYEYELVINSIEDYSGIKSGKIELLLSSKNIKTVDYQGEYLKIDLANSLNENTTYTMKVVIYDNAGNKTEESFSLKTLSNPVIKIVTAPSIKIDGKEGEYTNKDVNVTIIPADTSYQNYYCLNDNCSLISGTVNYKFDSTGVYKIYTKAVVENDTIKSNEYIIMIDKEAPTVSYNFVENNGVYTLSVSSNDNVDIDNVKVIISKGIDVIYQITKTEKSFVLTLTNNLELETTYYLQLIVTDKAGNQTSENSTIKTSLAEIDVIPLYISPEDNPNKYYSGVAVYIKKYYPISGYEDYYCVNDECEKLKDESFQRFFYGTSGEYSAYTKRVKGDREVTSSIYKFKVDAEISEIDGNIVSLKENRLSDNSFQYILNCLNIEDLSGIKKVDVIVYKIESNGYKNKKFDEDYNSLPLNIDLTNYFENNQKYEIDVTYRDEAGNSSSYTFEKYIFSELVMPTITYKDKHGFINDGSVVDNIHFYNVSAQANIVIDENTKDLAKTYYCLDNSCTLIESTTITIDFTKEGLYNFKVKTIYEGKETVIDERKIFIDWSAPTYKSFSYKKSPEETKTNIYTYSIDITGISDSLDAYGMKKHIILTIKDSQGDVVFTAFNSGTDDFKDSFHVTENKLEEGDYSVEILLQDDIMNSKTYYENIHIEKLKLYAPTVTTNTEYTQNINEWTNNGGIVVTFTASTENEEKDAVNSYCVRNHLETTTCTWIEFEGQVSVNIGDGMINISARISYGNYNVYSSNNGFFNVDTVAPVISKMASGYDIGWISPFINPSIHFECIEETSGISHYYIKNDQLYSEWYKFENGLLLGRYLDTGIYHFQAYAVDCAGNQSEIIEFDIRIDGRHPYTNDIDNIYEFSSSNGKKQIIVKNLYDDESGIEKITVRVYDKTSQSLVNKYVVIENVTMPCTIDISDLAEGEYYLLIEASDFVGNFAESDKIYFNIGGENSTFDYQENKNIYLSEISKPTKKVNNNLPIVIALISLLFAYVVINKTKIIKKF